MKAVVEALTTAQNLILLKLDSTRVAVGVGPFEKSFSNPGGACFYLQNFKMTLREPWLIPKQFALMDSEELLSYLGPVETPKFSIEEPEEQVYQTTFERFLGEIEQGKIDKAVPVIFSKLISKPEIYRYSIYKILSNNLLCHAFYVSIPGCFLVGAPPEILIEKRSRGTLVAEAVAGTVDSSQREKLLSSPRLSLEHQLVVMDLAQQLQQLGTVHISLKDRRNYGGLAHLYSEISTLLKSDVDLPTAIKAIHPTGAIGILPRNSSNAELVDALDPMHLREFYGAPLGVAMQDGTYKSTITIRSIIGNQDNLWVGSGGGLVAGSSLADEWAELKAKRNSVVSLLLS